MTRDEFLGLQETITLRLYDRFADFKEGDG
jgi:hypothetical protein